MVNTIITNFDIWTTAQTIKSNGRSISVDNQKQHGIDKLRGLILELAIQGKLVPQDPNDEAVSFLLGKIGKEKLRLIKDGIIRKPKELPEINAEEVPFKLPKGWEYIRLNDIGEWGSGSTPTRGKHEYYGGNIPWFKSGELVGDFISDSEEFITDLALKETSLRYNKIGDVLIAMYGATIGKTSILKVPATTNQAVCACTPFNGIYNVFLLTLLKAYKNRFIGMGAGGAQPNISREKIISTVIALPSSAEQHRIVAKVDELMALCDQLEQQQTNSNAAHQTLVETLLGTLTNAAGQADFEASWQRIATHFDTLFTTEYSIDQLKQTILQLAVMGKLVPQDPNDEPASELLKRIAKEKERLVKEGIIKKQEKLPEIEEEEKSSNLPETWVLVRLQDVTTLITDGKHGDCQDQPNSGYYFLSAKDIKDSKLNYDFGREINFKEFQETHRRTDLSPGDICMVNTGATVGKLAIAGDNPKTYKTTFQKSVAVIKPLKGFLLSEYLKVFLLGDVKNIFKKSGGSAINNLLLSDLKRKILPIPTLAEQQRIVAKVDELFAICDALKDRIKDEQHIQVQLAEAVVEGALG
jgi:type I restriction enzyme S subunit